MTDHLMTIMQQSAEAVQTIVREVDDFAQALRYVIDVTRNGGGSTIAAPGLDQKDRIALDQWCRGAGLTLLTANLRGHLHHIHTGFTVADWGIAETGTIVQDSSSEEIRLATMLCETHVAVLPLSRIRADAISLEYELHALIQSPPRYLSFISGASRTADIERVLTIGVHGPQELHILFLKDTE
jgi:L-lactate dehydrogenase complex protein LldG